jgi:hypothetical protein
MRLCHIGIGFVAVLLLSWGVAGSRFAGQARGTQFGLADASLSLLGEKENDWSGYSVAPAGDVNGDGFRDLLIGAPYAGTVSGKGQGKAYLFLGRPTSQWPAGHTSLAGADASFLGLKAATMAARQLYTAGDVNGDGYDDFLITCWMCWGSKGAAYLFLGRPDVDWGQDYPLEEPDARFIGENYDDRAGYYAATAGDVNGDGYDDFLITAVGDEEGGGFRAGQTYLILGRAQADWGIWFYLDQADASFLGEAEGDAAGRSASGVGDVDRDGYADFMIGAPFNDQVDVDAGKAYLVRGRKVADWGMDYGLAQADASFVGEAAGDQMGRRVCGAGDVNGDGYPDFLLGASYNDQVAPDAGKAYLLLGRPTVDWGQGHSVAQADASFLGENEGDQAGRRVSSAGDMNHDGVGDFIISAPHNDRAAAEAGASYLLYGQRSAGWGLDYPLSQADVVFEGEAANDHAGYDVAPLGDMNGDRVDDLVLGAYGADVNGDQSGETYVILSNWRRLYLPLTLRNK